jgi:hypothetical protein
LGISNTNLQNGISNTSALKRRLVFQIPIGTLGQQSEYKSRASTTCSRLKSNISKNVNVMPHYIYKMTGLWKKTKKMEFHCCITVHIDVQTKHKSALHHQHKSLAILCTMEDLSKWSLLKRFSNEMAPNPINLARQPCPAALSGSLARQPCSGSLARQA